MSAKIDAECCVGVGRGGAAVGEAGWGGVWDGVGWGGVGWGWLRWGGVGRGGVGHLGCQIVDSTGECCVVVEACDAAIGCHEVNAGLRARFYYLVVPLQRVELGCVWRGLCAQRVGDTTEDALGGGGLCMHVPRGALHDVVGEE